MANYRRFFLKGYNYIFLTVVTCYRQKILINNIELLRKSFKYARMKYEFEIVAGVVLPEHFHCVLRLNNENDYPEIVRLIKYYFSCHCSSNLPLSDSKIKKLEKGIWQRRYWEHIIRDEKDLNMHLDYIHYNPYKHYKIVPKDWKYSSFNKFVKADYYDIEWLNCNDKNKILDKEFE